MNHKLWKRRLPGGAEVSAALEYVGSADGATVTLMVRSAHAEDVTALGLADELRKLLDAQGATVLPGEAA
jgi:hypothetical protein